MNLKKERGLTMYDIIEIEQKVKVKRTRIIVKLSVVALLIGMAAIFAVLNISRSLTFSSILLVVFSFFAIYRIFDTELPLVAFSKEVKGENVLEDEYITGKSTSPDLAFGSVTPIMPNTRANRRRNGYRGCSVYLKLEDGNILILSGLTKAQIDLYNEGDILLKYKGTKYPIVLNRQIDNQPCPICGEINSVSSEACTGCGLKINGKTNEA